MEINIYGKRIEENKPKEQQAVVEDNTANDEDTLLKLLSEGKITVEEYKKLSKK